MAGFHFSSINHAMTSENPSDSINLFWNQQMEKNKANASLFLTPNFDPTIGFEYPEFGTFGNSLLNPMLAIQQTMQSFQNGSWMMGSNYAGGFNFPGFGNFGFGSPWGNFQSPWGTQDGQGGAGQGKTAEEKLQYAQYDKMKKILNEYKKVASDSEKAYIEEAMSKSGKIDEKLQALKDVSKKLDSSVIKESLLSMDPYKAQLIKSGLKVAKNDADQNLKTNLKLAAADLKAGNAETLTSSVITNDAEPNILNILSTWNDTHNTASDKNIIRLVASSIPSKADEQTHHKAAVEHIAKSLVAYVEKVKSDLNTENLSQLDASAEAVTEAWATASKSFTKDNVNKLAAKIDDLYARLRLIEAEKIRNNIQKDYKFVNDMTGKDIVNDKLIVSETVKDLKSEGISIPSNRDIVPSGVRDERVVSKLDDKPVDEQIEGLKSEKMLKASKVHKDVYTSNKSRYEPAHYYKKQGEQLVELKDVKSIDTKGVCTLRNGEHKPLSEVEKVEVSPTEIETYKNSLDKIHQLKQEGKMDKCSKPLPSWDKAGRTLYWSTYRRASGAHQCFVVLGNELMQINCKYVDENGKIVMEDGSTKEITQLTEDDCTPVNSSEVLAADEPKETKEKEEVKPQNVSNDNVEVDANATPAENGKVVRERLRGDSSKDDYDTAVSLIANLDKYSAEEVADFIEGYNNERGWKLLPWNGRICAQISTENDLDYKKKDACLRTIARGILKIMDELGISKNSYDYSEMRKYSQVGLNKQLSEDQSDDAWRAVAGGWKSWSAFGSKRTGAANHMDDIIKRVLEQYRNNSDKKTETKTEA